MLDKFHNLTNYMISGTQNNKLLNKPQLYRCLNAGINVLNMALIGAP